MAGDDSRYLEADGSLRTECCAGMGVNNVNNFTVGYFVGSLAKASLNRLLSKALIRLAPPGLQLVEIPFKDLPIFSPDYEADFPAVAQALKDAIASADAVLLTAPESERRFPGG